MHAHLQEVLPLLDDSRAVLKTAIDQVPEGLRRTRPSSERWSVAEVLEHLVKVNRLFAEPLDSAAGLALVALGVPAYYAWRYATRRQAANAEPALARNVS